MESKKVDKRITRSLILDIDIDIDDADIGIKISEKRGPTYTNY